MTPMRPFHDPETGGLDLERIVFEAGPIARLLTGFGLLGGFVLSLGLAFARSPLGPIFSFVGWLALAIGAFVTLLYVLLRAFQLSERGAPAHGPDRGSGDDDANGPESDAVDPESDATSPESTR